jgi:hypothetical protein
LAGATVLAAVTTLTLTGTALADIAPQGTIALGAERLFGVVATGTDTEGTNTDVTTISFAWSGRPGPYDRPRAAFDYFVIDNLSVGGSLGFYDWSASVEGNDAGDGGGFLLSPRVGYMVDITDMLGFWPRGGFTYVRDTYNNNGPDEVDTASALTLEAPLYILIGKELAINVGLTIDLGFDGQINRDAPGVDAHQEHNQFGIQVGLAGLL